MQELVTPESLDDLDRRVYDLAVQQMPLAELAVKLGVPIPQAHERLERVYARLGVSSRAELRELAAKPRSRPEPKADAGPTPGEYVIGAAPETVAEPRTIGRRRFVGTAAAVGVIAASGLGAVLLRGRRSPGKPDGNEDTLLGDQTSVVVPQAKPFPLAPRTGDGQSFVTGSWLQGAPIPWQHGVFFMRTSDGATSGFQFSPLADRSGEWAGYQAFADGQVFSATNGSVGALVHRLNLARSWTWDTGTYRLLEAFSWQPLLLLFESVNVRRTFHFVRVDEEGAEEFASFSSEAPPGVEPHVIRNGSLVAIFHGPLETPEIAVFNLRSGEQVGRAAINPQAQVKDVFVALPFQRLKDGFLARWMTPGNGRGDIPQRFYSAVFNWQGAQQGPFREDPPDRFYAPNGLWSATLTGQKSELRGATGPLANHGWHSTIVRHGGPEPAFRIRSATFAYGDELPSNRWLPELDGYVVAIRGGGDAPIRYALSRGGEPLVVLPTPPRPQIARWFDETWVQGAIPHPTVRGPISLGRLHLYNWITNQMFSAILESSSGPDHLDPWCAGPDEMVFALPHREHPLSVPPVLLAPKLEQPPFDDSFNFVVEVDPTGLNLREFAALHAPSLRVLQNGDRLTLTDSADASLPGDERSVRDFDAVRWFHVRTADGLEGWVNSTWLAWA